MLVQFQKVYLTAVILVYLTTPLYYLITQECIIFSINLSPAYLALLSAFWLLWLGYTSTTILLYFSKQNYIPSASRNRSEIEAVKCHVWTEMELNSSVDDALLGIINEILANHVLSWYSKISSDTDFTNEVRITNCDNLEYEFNALFRFAHCCTIWRVR